MKVICDLKARFKSIKQCKEKSLCMLDIHPVLNHYLFVTMLQSHPALLWKGDLWYCITRLHCTEESTLWSFTSPRENKKTNKIVIEYFVILSPEINFITTDLISILLFKSIFNEMIRFHDLKSLQFLDTFNLWFKSIQSGDL